MEPRGTSSEKFVRVADVEFPKSLIDEILNEEVVFFCGAGVSMGGNAKLPSFFELTKEVVGPDDFDRKEAEQHPDLVLGRMADQGKDVWGIAADFLSKAQIPNRSHLALAGLFSNREKVRIVTTNFDLLFERAFEQVHLDWKPRIFCATALPLERDFSGIAHIHGCVDNPKSMVLTDLDFGNAYVVEAWASRFLADVFRNRTVVFMGYSHNDPIVHYFSRAMIHNAKARYVLWPSKQSDASWKRVGVEVLPFPQKSKKDFRALDTILETFVAWKARNYTSWTSVINDALGHNPPTDPGGSSELSVAISHAWQHFAEKLVEYGGDSECESKLDALAWFEWLDKFLLPQGLSSLLESEDESSSIWLRWMLTLARKSGSLKLLSNRLVAVDSGKKCWNGMLDWLCQDVTDDLDSEMFDLFVQLYLQKSQSVHYSPYGVLLLTKCVSRSRIVFIPSLLELLLPRERLVSSSSHWEGKNSHARLEDLTDLDLYEDELIHWFSKNVRSLKDCVTNWALQRLAERYERDSVLGGMLAFNDDYSYRDVARKQPYGGFSAVDFCIEVILQSLKDAWTHDRSWAKSVTDRLFNSKCIVSLRLAWYGLQYRSELDAASPLTELLEIESLLHPGCRMDVERVFRTMFGSAGEGDRSLFGEGLALRIAKIDDVGTRKENAAAWTGLLNDVGYNASELQYLCSTENSAHYQSFGIGNPLPKAVVRQGGISPYSLQEMREWDFEIFWGRLLGWTEPGIRIESQIDSEGLRLELGKLFKEQRSLLSQLTGRLFSESQQKTVLWEGVFQYLQASEWEEEDLDLFAIISDHPKIVLNYEYLVRQVISAGSKALSNPKSIAKAQKFVGALQMILDVSRDSCMVSEAVLVNEAVNRLPGIVIESLFELLKLRPDDDSEPWLKANIWDSTLRGLLTDRSAVGAYARVIGGMRLGFLVWLDLGTVRTVFMDALSSRDREIFFQAWSGFLWDGRYYRGLGDELDHAYLYAMKNIEWLGELRKKFLSMFVTHATWRPNGIPGHWIVEFLNKIVSVDERIQMVQHVERRLRRSDDEHDEKKHEELVQKLVEYWKWRNRGHCGRLDGNESAQMLDWVPYLGTLYSQGVDHFMSSPLPKVGSGRFHHLLAKKEVVAKYPRKTMDLYEYLDRCNFRMIGAEAVLRILADSDDADVVGRAKNLMRKHGMIRGE